jgi:prepilin-type N-terminal cleavage/methylation domain-containing protein/prepilin-type processing-associated H-X9-DG protein
MSPLLKHRKKRIYIVFHVRQKKAFTLIELLVVISIIALLLSILMPGLQKAKESAKGIVCRSNLKQWGVCYYLYSQDYNGKLPEFDPATYRITYVESLRPYYGDINKMRTCPTAAKVDPSLEVTPGNPSYFGSTLKAWKLDTTVHWSDPDDWGIGSYAENSWIRDYRDPTLFHGSPAIETRHNGMEWGAFTKMSNPSSIPMIMDGRWNNLWPEQYVPGPCGTEEEFHNLSNYLTMTCVAMRRHSKGINVAMADGSCVPVDAEDLWTFKWHKTFTKVSDVDLSWIDW